MRRMWDLAEWLTIVGGCLTLMLLWTSPDAPVEASVQAESQSKTAPDEEKDTRPRPDGRLTGDEDKPGNGDPVSLEDLQELEERVQDCVKKIDKVTVGVQIGGAQGSGVVISKEGIVLTAAHVSGEPGRLATVVLPSGRRLRAKTLGRNGPLDASLVQITSRGSWDFAEMGVSKDVKIGDWCVAMGHPGGYMRGRPPVVRVGRVVTHRRSVIQTDCSLVGGDSGGPLFDLDGNVIGIHSRIGAATDWNFHVPVDVYRDNWDRLVNSENLRRSSKARLGITGETIENGCRIEQVIAGSAAEKAGLKRNDVIVEFEGGAVRGIESLIDLVGKQKPGDEITVAFLRDGKRQKAQVTLGESS